ncbi:MAG: carboxypeptidase regulatory-like domain-containing protein [Chloroflexi bacterium]|nr:carboxypeptidase regulatory-like domain-containing protein [Chloroflexota bacterium]MCC6892224.1 carboxypeptidase regulatory-like domain-containing protein [Anaerolineae bacterium]
MIKRRIWGTTAALCLLLVTTLLLSTSLVVQAADPLTIYGDGLLSGWANWSWNTTINVSATTPVHGGSRSLSTKYDAAWAGLYLRSGAALPAGYDTLRFWVNGGTGGQQVKIAFYDVNSNAVEGKVVQAAANTWTQVDVPLAVFGSSSSLWGIVWQENTGNAQPVFYLDDIQLLTLGVAPQPTQTGLTLSVDAAAARRPISPYIYGLNFADPALAADIKLPVNRWGGNSTTRYNFKLDTHSTASDWYFENIPDDNANPAALPNGSGADNFVAANKGRGTDTVMTLPLIGWTPKSRAYACGFSVTKYGAQQGTDPYRPDCGNGVKPDGSFVTGNNPTDTSLAITPAFVQEWIAHLKGTFGASGSGGVRFYNLDNEPMLWNSTHRDVHPAPLSYDELRDRTYQYGAAVKAADPAAQTLGPVEWGWTGYFYSALDAASGGAWWNNPVDRNAHGGMELTAWYLDQMKKYEQANGVRILDYLDLHYYPQAGGVALTGAGGQATQDLRLRSTRSLWDPTYVDESWIADEIRMIPRMRDWVNTYYPGTKLAMTEYNFGGLEHINGALTQADVLGIFGREGLDLATMWDPPTAAQPAAYAFRMYRNYNGLGGMFGETSVSATSADQAKLSVYAALRADGALTVMVINKTGNGQTSSLNLANFSAAAAQVYTYSAANLSQIVRGADVPVNAGSISTTYPAQSITLLVIPSGAPLPTASPTLVPSATNTNTPTVTATVTMTKTLTPTVTATKTLTPTSTVVLPTATATATATVPTSTIPPIATTAPTLTATPNGPTVTIEVSPASGAVGSTVKAALKVSGISSLYGLQADCQVNAAVLTGTGVTAGDIFSSSNSFIVNDGFKPDGKWSVAGSLLNPAPAFNGAGTAFTLNFSVVGAGQTAVNCAVLAVDLDGSVLPLTVNNSSFLAVEPSGATVTATVVPPTATAAPPSATPLPTLTFTPSPTLTPVAGAISGQAAYEKRGDQSGITVTVLVGDANGAAYSTAQTAADGSFRFDGVPAGVYFLRFTAAGHLPTSTTVTVEAGQGAAAQVTLLAGDIDGSGSIDLTDAGFIGANYRVQVPPAPAAADLNGDGFINLVDLVLVGKNFGKTGG